jgi:hypothetical protein
MCCGIFVSSFKNNCCVIGVFFRVGYISTKATSREYRTGGLCLTSFFDYSGEYNTDDAIIKNKYANRQIYKIGPLHGAHGDIYVEATCGKLQDSFQVQSIITNAIKME